MNSGTSYKHHQAPPSRHASRSIRPHSSYPQRGGGKVQQATHDPFRCNDRRCSKALVTTVFVLKCHHVFCEDCAFKHFKQSTVCPICRANLREEDFFELCIAAPSAQDNSQQMMMQQLLTKKSAAYNHVSHTDMANHVLKSLDQSKQMCSFLLKQMTLQAHLQYCKQAELARQAHNANKAYTEIKQSQTSTQKQYEQEIQQLKNMQTALQAKNEKMEHELNEKNKQISKFRSSFGSSHSTGSNNSGGVRHDYQRSRPSSTGFPKPSAHAAMSMSHPRQQQQQQQQQRSCYPPVEQGPPGMLAPTPIQHPNISFDSGYSPTVDSLGRGGIRNLSSSTSSYSTRGGNGHHQRHNAGLFNKHGSRSY